MKKWLVVLVLVFFPFAAFSADISQQELRQLAETIKELKERVASLEERLKKYEESGAKGAGAGDVAEMEKTLSSLKEALGSIKISADITMVGQGTINNGDNIRGEGDVQDGAWSFDFEVESKLWKGATAYMLMEGGQGEGVEDEVPTLSGFNDDAPGTESAHVEVTKAWWEQEWEGKWGSFVFTLGKVDISDFFDANDVANDETTQFLSSGFVHNLAVEWPDDNGPGARLTFQPGDTLYVSLGWAEADGDWEDIFDDGFGIVEVGLHTKLFGLDGNYRVYAWVNCKDHLDVSHLKDVAEGKRAVSEVDDDKTNWGVGFSFDQMVAENMKLFLRGGIMDSDVVSGSVEGDGISVDTLPINGALSFGFSVSGACWGRAGDELGVAFGVVFVDDEAQKFYRNTELTDYYDYFRKPDRVDIANEYHLEAYYRISFFDGRLEFTPDFQVVWNPNGIDNADTVYVLGTRMQVNF